MEEDAASTSSLDSTPSLSAPPPPSEETLKILRPYFANGPKSLSGIALRAFCLGSVFSASVVLCIAALFFLPPSPASSSSPSSSDDDGDAVVVRPWRAPFFLAALSTFHFLEFWTTAHRNTLVASIDSFLLTANWPAYAVAHASALAECVVVDLAFPGFRSTFWGGASPTLVGLGLVMVVGGQAVRSAAMLQAGASFNHQVQTRKSHSHRLVTDGVYGYLRHPSYFGFFYWGLGTQLMLGNAVCFAAYAAVLWLFFNDRVRTEERRLVEFFGRDYIAYRDRVGTMIPFVG